jgi:hypothetical protein
MSVIPTLCVTDAAGLTRGVSNKGSWASAGDAAPANTTQEMNTYILCFMGPSSEIWNIREV